MTEQHTDDHILVVGGTSGTGKAFAAHVAAKKQRVSVLGRKKCELMGSHVWSQTLDLTVSDKVIPALEDAVKKQGAFTGVVLFQRYRGSQQDWDAELSVSLTASKTIIEFCVDHFAASADDKPIVAVSSMASTLVADEQPASYHVAKAGLNQLMRFYAHSLGPRGVRVNIVTPGTVIKEENREFFAANRELTDFYSKIIPLKRLGTSRDIINVIDYLLSPAAAFVTGQNIVVDGGLSLALQDSLAREVSGLKHPNAAREKIK